MEFQVLSIVPSQSLYSYMDVVQMRFESIVAVMWNAHVYGLEVVYMVSTTCEEIMRSLRPVASAAPLLEGLTQRASLDTLMTVLGDAAEIDMMSDPLPRRLFSPLYEDPPTVPTLPAELRPRAHEHLWLASAAEHGDSQGVLAGRALCCLVFLHNWPEADDTLRLGCLAGYSAKVHPCLAVPVLQYLGSYYYEVLPDDARVEGVAKDFVRALALTLAIGAESSVAALHSEGGVEGECRVLRAFASELPRSTSWEIVLRWIAPEL
jgi:hypothetical protein